MRSIPSNLASRSFPDWLRSLVSALFRRVILGSGGGECAWLFNSFSSPSFLLARDGGTEAPRTEVARGLKRLAIRHRCVNDPEGVAPWTQTDHWPMYGDGAQR